MVRNTGGPLVTRRIRRLSTPLALEVVEADDVPQRLLMGGQWQAVSLTARPWRVDQYWWRDARVRRDYFRVAPENGPPLTIYHDLVSGEWARQEY